MQKITSLVVTGALTLLVGSVMAAPTTDLPQVPEKKMQPVQTNAVKAADEKDHKNSSGADKAAASASADKPKKASAAPEPTPKAAPATEPKQASVAAANTTAPPETKVVDAKTVSAKKGDAKEGDVKADDAAKPEPVSEEQKEKENNEAVQDHLASMVEDDYEFERMRRKLSNMLELAKLQSQIRKLNGEDKKGPAPVSAPAPAPAPAPAAPQAAAKSVTPVEMPRVVLEAEIGGTNRVAVTSGGTLRYVRPGETFRIGSNSYRLAKDRKSVVMAGESAQ